MDNKKVLLIVIILGIACVGGASYVYFNHNIQNYKIDSSYNDKSSDDAQDSKKDDSSIGTTSKENEHLKNITSYDELESYISLEKNIFVVLGQTGCTHCQRFYPVIENTSKNYSLDILYVDVKALSKEEQEKLFNSPIVIPSKCNNKGVDITLNQGFGTPLSLFINNKKTYECIPGYQNENDLIKFLRKIGYLGE